MRRACPLPRAPVAPGSHARSATDPELRRDGLLHVTHRGGGCRDRTDDQDLEARREPRRRREPHRAARADDARVDGRCAVRRSTQPHPAVRRAGGGRGPDRGSRSGARRMTPEPIDLHHQAPGIIGSYLLDTPGGPALFDCGPTSTLPYLKAGLAERGLDLSEVKHLLLSHIHLDHAGAAGVLVRENPWLQVHVSEVGAPHLIDPSKLEASARRLYGGAFDDLWGELAPIPERNVHIVGDRILGLDCFPTPGHAWHHVSYLDENGTLFAGDAAGVRIGSGRFVTAPCPPPEFDLEAWERSISDRKSVV